MNKPIHIFKTGKHTANDGTTLTFTEGMVASIVTSYNPALHEAPITVGHPADNLPAFGWIKGLTLNGGDVEAEPHQVDPAFAEMVAAGRFKKRSASLYSPDSPNNPVPGQWYLRHVGFLGAQPPAIKGLRDCQFAAGEQGVVEFMEQGDAGLLASLFRGLREAWIEKFGKDAADTVIPTWAIGDLEVMARPPAPQETPISSFADPSGEVAMTPEQIAALQAREAAVKEQETTMAAKQAALEAQEKAFAEQAANAANAAFKARVDALVTAGKLTPAQAPKVLAIGVSMAPAVAVEFAEAGKTVQGNARDLLIQVFEHAPAGMEFGERRMDPATTGEVDSTKLAAKIREYRAEKEAKGLTVSYAEAATAVLAAGI